MIKKKLEKKEKKKKRKREQRRLEALSAAAEAEEMATAALAPTAEVMQLGWAGISLNFLCSLFQSISNQFIQFYPTHLYINSTIKSAPQQHQPNPEARQ